MIPRQLFLILSFALLASCQWPNNDRPSVLVLAIEEFGTSELNCANESDVASRSGLQIFCNEAIRFSHAFSTSSQAVPAVASILTGLLPPEHGLRHHGASWLKSDIRTVAEVATQKKYATSFFSAGAPLARRTFLHRGFEIFDDYATPTRKVPLRTFASNIELFLSWQDQTNQPFFSVVHGADLLFPFTQTQNDLGELRELSFQSQLEELDERLFSLVQQLKARGVWDTSYIVLVGLTGSKEYHRGNVIPPLNVLSDRSQVSLLIKPPRPQKDYGRFWSVDENVSLADVGQTLLSIFDSKVSSGKNAISLLPSLQSPQNKISKNRILWVESAWPHQFGIRQVKKSVRKGQWVCVNDRRLSIYNSLSDRLELSPLSSNDPGYSEISSECQNIFRTIPRFEMQDVAPVAEKFTLLAEALDPTPFQTGQTRTIEELQSLLPNDPWLNPFVAGKQNGELTECEKSVIEKKSLPQIRKFCDHPMVLLAAELFQARDFESSDLDSIKKELVQLAYYAKVDHRLLELDYLLYGNWDISLQNRTQVPTFDRLMQKPQMNKLRSWLERTLQQMPDYNL